MGRYLRNPSRRSEFGTIAQSSSDQRPAANIPNSPIARTSYPFLDCDGDGIPYIDVYVKPNARTVGIHGIYNERLKIGLTSPPVDGKANKELCEFCARQFNVARGDVRIVWGERGRNKRISLRNTTENAVWANLSDVISG